MSVEIEIIDSIIIHKSSMNRLDLGHFAWDALHYSFKMKELYPKSLEKWERPEKRVLKSA